MNPTVPSISIYAALLALLAAALTVNVILNRVRSGVASGDGGVSGLARAIRAHANFTEQAPIALIAIACGEASGVRPFVINILGVALIVARLTAAYALNRSIRSVAAAPVRGRFEHPHSRRCQYRRFAGYVRDALK